jgi:uncharacterized protein YyaL (SSP411 family)
MPNRLIHALSPYLRQHAHNPVDWYPWGEEALEKARRESKPIFLSIGYAACHWCHVMAHESFEDAEIAQILNEHFVPIKVDREERPDLDEIYMQATIALSGQGGWPMSVFLTPDLQPFFAGTYFPKEPRYRLPSFRQVLLAVLEAWQNERSRILASAESITRQLQASLLNAYPGALTLQWLDAITEELLRTYDWVHGGWGGPPKFPQPLLIEFLLHQAWKGNAQALEVCLHALRCMAKGGMYDWVGGGFHRYSVDAQWLVPHFEKMLYDNALLARVYLHAWQLTRDPFFYHIAEATLRFLARELTHPRGGFFSSLDADSEGEEGKYYVWTADELEEVLKEDYPLFRSAFNIRPFGNWEGKTVLQRALDDHSLARQFGISVEEVETRLERGREALFRYRQARVPPATDVKVITSWNGLALATLAEFAWFADRLPGGAWGESQMLTGSLEGLSLVAQSDWYLLATRNAKFLLDALGYPDLRHAWNDGLLSQEGFLEDYASLILGLLQLYLCDFNPTWYQAARTLTEAMLRHFYDPQQGFFDTPSAEGLPFRPRQVQDNAIPSGSALAVTALLRMSALEGKTEWRTIAERSIEQQAALIARYPHAFGQWLLAADLALTPSQEIALLGRSFQDLHLLLQTMRQGWYPYTVIAASAFPPSPESPALLHDRPLQDVASAYVCHHFVCERPVSTPEELHALLNRPTSPTS